MRSRTLTLSEPEFDEERTAILRRIKLHARPKDLSLNEAVISAAYAARKNRTVYYVYGGNSYGRAVYRSTYNLDDALDRINNTGSSMLAILPDLSIYHYEVMGR